MTQQPLALAIALALARCLRAPLRPARSPSHARSRKLALATLARSLDLSQMAKVGAQPTNAQIAKEERDNLLSSGDSAAGSA